MFYFDMENGALEDALFNVYLSYEKCCNEKKLPKLAQSKTISFRADFLRKMDKYIYYLKSSSTTETEKISVVAKCKALYRQYCTQLKSNPEIASESFVEKIHKLLHAISTYEAEKIELLLGENFDINNFTSIFEDGLSIMCLVNNSIEDFVKKHLSNSSPLSKSNIVYITSTGTKYHEMDCIYCQNKTLFEIPENDAVEKGFLPCTCLEKKTTPVTEQKEIVVDHSKFVTVFIDESVRRNPWRTMDYTLPEMQGVYSYIICNGFLNDELCINRKNTLHTKVQAIEGARKTNEVAVEAIHSALFQLVTDGYTGNVRIFTDNLAAKNTWKSSLASQNLLRLFASVSVSHIPREQNTIADKIGRDRVLLDIPATLAYKIVKKCDVFDKMRDSFKELINDFE